MFPNVKSKIQNRENINKGKNVFNKNRLSHYPEIAPAGCLPFQYFLSLNIQRCYRHRDRGNIDIHVAFIRKIRLYVLFFLPALFLLLNGLPDISPMSLGVLLRRSEWLWGVKLAPLHVYVYAIVSLSPIWVYYVCLFSKFFATKKCDSEHPYKYMSIHIPNTFYFRMNSQQQNCCGLESAILINPLLSLIQHSFVLFLSLKKKPKH